MSIFDSSLLSRRRVLKLSAGLAGGLMITGPFTRSLAFADDCDNDTDDHTTPSKEVQDQIQEIIQAEGSASNGVVSIEIDRDDIPDVTLHGVPIKPSFEINGDLNFQKICDSRKIMMNSDLCIK